MSDFPHLCSLAINVVKFTYYLNICIDHSQVSSTLQVLHCNTVPYAMCTHSVSLDCVHWVHEWRMSCKHCFILDSSSIQPRPDLRGTCHGTWNLELLAFSPLEKMEVLCPGTGRRTTFPVMAPFLILLNVATWELSSIRLSWKCGI